MARTRLHRKAGYWVTSASWLNRSKGRPAILHEDEQAVGVWLKRKVWVNLADARLAEKLGHARLCKRCGGMK